jgi:acetyltransferase-like isoleucine patch superfamily enzyme
MNPTEPSISAQQRMLTPPSLLDAVVVYKRLHVGDSSWLFFLFWELLSLLILSLGGLVGFFLRMVLIPPFLSRCGARLALGKGAVIKNPAAIQMGRKVLIDDYVSLEAKGEKSSIVLGDRVSIGRFSLVVAKSASIVLGSGVNVSSNVRIASQSKVEIGASTLIAAYVYIGPGNHIRQDPEQPIIESPMDIKGGVLIGKNCWIGAHATIMDGVTIGDGATVGAHSLVRSDVPAGATVVGIPARPL